MKRFIVLPALPLLMLCGTREAAAEPAWGGNCLSCHGELVTGLVDVFGEDTTADPDESATGAPDRGTLKVFQATPRETKTLQVEVVGLDPDDTYAVELKRLRFAGVEGGGELTYGADCNWPEWGESSAYYSEPAVAYRWGTGPITFSYEIEVEPDAPYDYDYYDLVLAVAGKLSDGGGLFYAEEHFYLQVQTAPGDLDEDGDVDLTDYSTFSTCLGGPDVATPPPGCNSQDFEASDLDDDNDVDLEDSATFTANFTG